MSQTDTIKINSLNKRSENLSKVDVDSSSYLAQEALTLAKEANFKRGIASATKNLAICNYVNGKSDVAIKQFIEAIKLFEDLKDINELAHCYSQMGIAYYLQYQYDNALKYYEKSIELYRKTTNKKDLAGVYINQGISYTYVKKMDLAEINYNEALKIYQEINYEPGFAPAYNSLAKIYYAKKEYVKAISYYKLAEQYSIKSNNKYHLITNYNSLAMCYKELKEYETAKSYSEKSITISKEVGSVERELFCHETMADILFSMGDYKNAYASFQNYASLKDTLFNQDKNDAIAEMQAKFDVEKNQQKVKEIELQKKIDDETNAKKQLLLVVVIVVILISLIFTIILFRNKQKVNSLLEQKNAAIQANLEQKEMMMSEIHHRVKNNLQMVSSILDLQARDLTDEKSIQVIEDSLSRINAISLIHQRLYQSDNIRGVKINNYLQELALDILKNFSSTSQTKSIELQCHIDDLDMDLESAIPIGLITAELIINACKYAFTSIEKPEIKITLNKRDGLLLLTVADNGIGKQVSLNDSGTTFGTKLIKSLSRKLRAEINEDTSSKGTSVQLKINNFKLYDL
ncbi:MAG TPA: histidine kinase dimerization/phosphoacceptor domain -containing protein [Bacteroidia bacterium]|nr:histidine kinase dimerization/phosphoacceptor domain -containing protein [Bacteroidia bacterium]